MGPPGGNKLLEHLSLNSCLDLGPDGDFVAGGAGEVDAAAVRGSRGVGDLAAGVGDRLLGRGQIFGVEDNEGAAARRRRGVGGTEAAFDDD